MNKFSRTLNVHLHKTKINTVCIKGKHACSVERKDIYTFKYIYWKRTALYGATEKRPFIAIALFLESMDGILMAMRT